MPNRQVFTVAVRKRMVRQYRDGASTSELMRLYGASHGTIRAELLRAGVEVRGVGRPRGCVTGKIGSLAVDTAVKLRRRGAKLRAIARLAGVTPQSVCRALKVAAR